MRQPFLFALAALGSFAMGFAVVRSMERETPRAAPARAPKRVAATPAPEPVDDSPAAAQRRLDAVFKLGGQQPGHIRDANLYAALLELDAADFLAAAADFPALLARVSENRWVDGKQVPFVEAWMDRWLAVDAPGALRFLGTSPFLGQLPDGGDGVARQHQWGTEQGAAIRALARREPRWTHDWLAAQPAKAQRDSAIYALLEQAARQDPAQARKFLASFSDGVNRLAAVEGFVTGLAAADPRAGFEAALAQKAAPFRESLLEVAIGEAGKRGVALVSEMLDRIDDPQMRFGLAWKGLDSARRHGSDDLLPWIIDESRRAEKWLGGYRTEEWAIAVAEAVQGPRTASAAELAATLANDPKRKVLGKIAGVWAGKEPDALRAWLVGAASTLDAAAIEALGPALTRLAKADRAATQTWADALPPGRFREQAQFQIALRSGDTAQVAAVYESFAARDADGALAKEVADVLVAKDGAAAAEWAMHRADGPARREAIAQVAEQWGERDPHAAAEWLGKMPPGPDRDRAVREYAWKVAFADPIAAAEWAEQVVDPKERQYAAVSVFHQWNSENPVAARVWLRGLPGLDDEFREKLLRNFR